MADLVAAYDLPTALLHWSLLPPQRRGPGAHLPQGLVRYLDLSAQWEHVKLASLGSL